MGGVSKLSAEQVAYMTRRREIGWSYRAIAGHLGVSDGAIRYQCMSRGIISPLQRWRAPPVEPVARICRNGQVQRTFTAADDARLLELEREGLKLKAIAERMGRARTSVRMRLLRLGMREDLPA